MTTTYTLSAERVNEIFLDCLFRDGEDTSSHVRAEGTLYTVGFHPERLESHREEIVGMLDELPNEFKFDGGGGWSFLNACNDRHGNQWTGMHQTMDQLVTLGIAISKVAFQLPRELWSVMPGGMPYFTVS